MARRHRDQVDLYDIPDTAARLGCSEMHVYRLIAAGELRAVDIASASARRSKTRVRSDDLAAYIESRTRDVAKARSLWSGSLLIPRR